MEQIYTAIKKYLKNIDIPMILLALAASCYGILLVFSTTNVGGAIGRHAIVQGAALFLGLIAMIIISNLDYEILCDLWIVLYVLAIGAVAFTILFGKGPTGDSNRNWIYLGPVSIQPLEFVKIAYVLIVAKVIDKCKENINSFKSLFFIGSVIGGLLIVIGLQGDLGNALVFMFMTAVTLFAAGLSIWYFISVLAVILLASPFIWNALPQYMQNRIIFGFRPELDPTNVGYQAVQSKIAIGSGETFGKGFLQGTQINLLPANETDFIFSTAGEEFGFVGSVIIILLLSAIIIKALLYARRTDSDIGSLICIGIFAMLFAQTTENIGMCLALLPVVGITLPFFSYGGSSMISCWCAIGVLMSVYSKRQGLHFGEE